MTFLEKNKPESDNEPTQAITAPLYVEKCGQPYQYPVPKCDGDPWDVLLTHVLKQDAQRCARLQEQVQLSLVVAALFSAVGVALLVDSWSDLDADPMDEIIYLLTRLVTTIENPENTTLSSTPLLSWEQVQDDSESEPTLTNIGAVGCYYISVWFSMAVVVIGVSTLQWIQAHQSYPASTPKQRFAMFHMRKLSFDKWGIAPLIRLLPVLLLMALYTVLLALSNLFMLAFFVVLFQILFGFVLTFSIFLVTILPVLQEYMLQYPRINPFLYGRVQATPCPYRSIQANIMRITVIFNKVSFFIFIFFAYVLLIPIHIVVMTYKRVWLSKTKFHFSVPRFYSPYRRGGWSLLDWEWLMIRWTHFTELYDTYLGVEVKPRDVSGLHFDDRLLYDAIEGLIQVSEHNVTEAHILYAAYQCFEELSSRVLSMQSSKRLSSKVAEPDIIRNNRYVQALLANPGNLLPFHASSLSSAMTHPTIDLLHEENLLLFIQAIFTRGAARLTADESPNPIWPPAFSSSHLSVMAQHLGELHLRVKGHMFVEQLRHDSVILNPENPNLLPQHVDWSIVYLFQYVEDFEVKKVFAERYTEILSAFFSTAGSDTHIAWKMGGLLTHRNLYHFILNGARTTHYALNHLHGLDESSLNQLLSAFLPIREGLIQHLTRQESSDGPRPDVLFYSTCIYVQWLTEREAGYNLLMDALADVIPVLRAYKEHMHTTNYDLEKSLGVPFSDNWWSFLALPEKPGVNSSQSPVNIMTKRKARGVRLLSRFSRRGSPKTVLEVQPQTTTIAGAVSELESGTRPVDSTVVHMYPPNAAGEDTVGAPLLPRDLV